MAFIVTLDACVLHRPGVRDLLLRLAWKDLYQPTWSNDILEEMVQSILKARSDLDRERLTRTRTQMLKAFPNALIGGYEELVQGLHLPDANDRHVLAAAIRAGAQVIVTDNLADFPKQQLGKYKIEAQTPDTFVLHLIDLAPATASQVIQAQAAALHKPPMSLSNVLDGLTKAGLPRSVAELRRHLKLRSVAGS